MGKCHLDKCCLVVSSDVPTLPLIEDSPPQPLSLPTLRDELCPDKDYILPADNQDLPPQHIVDTIPQLDGHGDATEQLEHEDLDNWINPNPETGLWVCRCCEYAHCFPTEDDLRMHHDKLIFE